MDAHVAVSISDSPLSAWPPMSRTDCGAVVDFHGLVRDQENGGTIAGLDYEAYRPMAERELERIARELLATYPCREVHVSHRVGFVPAGEASISVRIISAHRGEAIVFLELFMNRLKQDVPIWKRTSPSLAPKK